MSARQFPIHPSDHQSASPSKAARNKAREDALRLIKEFVREHEAGL